MSTKEAARGGWEYWDNMAADFDGFNERIVGSSEAAVDAWLVAQLKAEDSVVELACGTGRYSRLMAPKVASLLATDQAPRMLEQAEAKLKGFENVELQRADATDTGLPEASFDLAVMGNLLHVVPAPEQVVAEAARLLKPGGRLIAVDYTAEGASSWTLLRMMLRMAMTWGRPSADSRKITRAELRQLAEDAGLVVQRCELLGQQVKAAVMVAEKPA